MHTLAFLILTIVALSFTPAWAQLDVNGILNTQAEYDFMKLKVQQGEEPWTSAYNSLSSACSYTPNMPASITVTISNPPASYPMRREFIYAYAAALRWRVGGLESCRTKAIALLNNEKTLQTFNGDDHRKLDVSWFFPPAISAAWIMKHTPGSGWSVSDQNSWQSWAQAKMVPFFQGTNCPRTFTGSCHNWAAYGQNVRSAWGVYTNNSAMLTAVKADYREFVQYYVSKFGKPQVFDGFSYETCRKGNTTTGGLEGSDFSHVTMSFNGLLATAEIHKKQGDPSLYSFLGSDDGFGLRQALLGHGAFAFSPERSGSRPESEWPCVQALNLDAFHHSKASMAWNAAWNHYGDSLFKTLSNYQGNLPILGPTADRRNNDSVNVAFDRLTHNTRGLSIPEPEPPNPDPEPTGSQRWVSETGTGIACTPSAPCSWATGVTSLPPGATIHVIGSLTGISCVGCLPSGISAAQPTRVTSSVAGGSTLLVGGRGIQVIPGAGSLTASTGVLFEIPAGRSNIVLEGLTMTSSGTGTNPLIRVGNTSGTGAVNGIIIRNNDISAPTRSGESCLSTSGAGVTGVRIEQNRIHDCGMFPAFEEVPAPATAGLYLRRGSHVVQDNDITRNSGHGIRTDCAGCIPDNSSQQYSFNKIMGNGGHGMELEDGTDIVATRNQISLNGLDGINATEATKRILAYNNTVHDNSQVIGGDFTGIRAHAALTGVFRNNVSTGHPTNDYVIPAVTGIACSHNTSSVATNPLATGCTDMTASAVATDLYEDPDNGTVLSRNFTPKTAASIIDTGTTEICVAPTDTGANRCPLALTLTGIVGSGIDRGAIEKDIPVVNSLVSSFLFNNDVVDTAGPNEGTATSITFEATEKVEGSHAAILNAATDKVVAGTVGMRIASFTVAVNARNVGHTPGAQQYILGHTDCPSSYCNRIQLYLNSLGNYAVGLGGSHNTIVTTRPPTTNAYDLIHLVVDGLTARLRVNGLQVAQGTFTGLTRLAATLTIGNNAGANDEAWNGQLDNMRFWNYALSDAELDADCVVNCKQPSTVPPDEFDPLVPSGCAIGSAGLSVQCQLEGSPDPASCNTLADFEVTVGGVDNPVTACNINASLAPQILTLILTNIVPPGDVTLFIYQDDPDPVAVSNPPLQVFDPIQLLEGETDTTGLIVTLKSQGIIDPAICNVTGAFILRDACVEVGVSSCSVEHQATTSLIRLTRLTPPATDTTVLDVLVTSTDSRMGITNNLDLGNLPPDVPDVTGLSTKHWKCRIDAATTSQLWKGRGDEVCQGKSPGSLNMRISVANESGATITDFRTTLWAARDDGAGFGSFVKVTPTVNSLGVSYGPLPTFGIPDNDLITAAELDIPGGLTFVGDGRFRRTENAAVGLSLADDRIVEYEYSVRFAPLIPIGTDFIFQVRDGLGRELDAYAGLPACDPCGVPVTIMAPSVRRR